MSTKVKGEAIKEGSVRYEALDKGLSFVPALTEFVKKLQKEDVNTSIEIPYASQIHIFIGSKNKIVRITTGQSYTIKDYGDSVTLSVSQSDSSLILNISSMINPLFIEGFGVYIYKNLNKIRTEFLPDIKTPTPDWNAQKGEAGYIENKPFGIGEELIPLDMIVKFSQLQKVSVDWASNVFDVYLHPDPGYDSFISKDINPDADDILNIKEKGAGRVFGYSINNKMIYEEINHNNFNQTLDGIDTQFDFVLGMKYSQDTIRDTGNYFVVYEGVMYVIHNITYNKIYNDESYMNVHHTEKIHENYLPDTVLKTTPQTLSDTDKNQALANLGIDPVVWKYICNPFVIKINGRDCYVPEELVDLDSLFDSGDYGRVYTWKYLIPAMYVGYHDMDGSYFAVTYGEPSNNVPTLGFNNVSIYINEEFKVVC